MKSTRLTTPRSAEAGFTLVELIASLAVLSLVVGLSMEGVFARVKESLRRDEAARLQTLGGALRRAVQAQRMIPGSTQWAEMVSMELDEPGDRIRRNQAGWERRLIYDPGFRIGTNGSPPPFVQDGQGSPTLTGARAILISTMASELPNLSGVGFGDLWNRVDDRFPVGWPSRWGGRPADVLLHRITFQDLFSPICLNNMDPDVEARFAVDTQTNEVSIPGGARVETQFLRGTRLQLLAAGGGIEWIETVDEPVSFVCESGRWRRGLSSGPTVVGSSWAAAFGRLASGGATAWHARPVDVAVAIQSFLSTYVEWAGRGYPRESEIPGRHDPSWRRIQDASAQVEHASALLLGLSPEGLP